MGPKGAAKPAAPAVPAAAEGEYLRKDLDTVYVKHTTMNPAMQEAAVNALREGLDKYNLERDIAGHVKQVFESAYGPYWQCIVGKNYGSFVSYEENYMFFYVGRIAVVLYKNGCEETSNGDHDENHNKPDKNNKSNKNDDDDDRNSASRKKSNKIDDDRRSMRSNR